jgi:hypothetical protein
MVCTRTRYLRNWAPAIAILLTVAGCGGPTNPGLLVAVAGSVTSQGLTATLLQIEVVWDGKVVGSEQAATGQFALIGGGSTSASPGNHTVGIRVVRQTVASDAYEITGRVNSTNVTTGAIQDVDLGPKLQILSSGQLVTFSVTLR